MGGRAGNRKIEVPAAATAYVASRHRPPANDNYQSLARRVRRWATMVLLAALVAALVLALL